jgi:SAM-dependent methyltransferase
VGYQKNTRRSYDRVAKHYANEFLDELDRKPLDRALLAMLAEELGSTSPVADLGSGPGHVAAFLAARGVRATALDLSPAMAAVAQQQELAAVAGSLTALPFGPGTLGGAVALYCLIHLDPADVEAAVAELGRVIRPGGPVLLAFHTGTEVIHRDEWWGEPVDLDFRFLEAGPVTDALVAAGFSVEVVLERAPYPQEAPTQRTYILARRTT